jgi:hypothetical protein
MIIGNKYIGVALGENGSVYLAESDANCISSLIAELLPWR